MGSRQEQEVKVRNKRKIVPMNLPPKKPKDKKSNKRKKEDSTASGSKKLKMDSFGARFEEDWPAEDYKPDWINESTEVVKKPKLMELDKLIQNSTEFPIPFPVETARCNYLKSKISKEELERNINSTYPILHERVLQLYDNFLKYKRQFGTAVEKDVYRDMDVAGLVNRFLRSRAVSFFAANDKWQLLSKKTGIAGWDKVGTDLESAPLLVKDVISYDEIKLSAFLYVSGYTHFVNDGNRKNCGVAERNRSVIEKEGVIIGLIGARLKRKHVMEYQDMIVTKEQNSPQNGFSKSQPSDAVAIAKYKWRKLWSDFYEEEINVFSDVEKAAQSDQDSQYFPARAKNAYFDNMYYKKRLTVAFDALLFEADYRARKASKMAFIHMVGIGLGVWRNAEHQEPAFLEVFVQRLKVLREHTHNISDVHFAYFSTRPTDKVKDGMKIEDSKHPKGGVRIHISKREPSSRLTGQHEGKLLIATYAWDGNAQPGNEYWMKMLKSTGDSAAACSTQVTELHNAHINTRNVCAENLRVASHRHGLIGYGDYVKKCLQQ